MAKCCLYKNYTNGQKCVLSVLILCMCVNCFCVKLTFVFSIKYVFFCVLDFYLLPRSDFHDILRKRKKNFLGSNFALVPEALLWRYRIGMVVLFVCIVLTSLSTSFQSCHDGVYLQQRAQCHFYSAAFTRISCRRHMA